MRLIIIVCFAIMTMGCRTTRHLPNECTELIDLLKYRILPDTGTSYSFMFINPQHRKLSPEKDLGFFPYKTDRMLEYDDFRMEISNFNKASTKQCQIKRNQIVEAIGKETYHNYFVPKGTETYHNRDLYNGYSFYRLDIGYNCKGNLSHILTGEPHCNEIQIFYVNDTLTKIYCGGDGWDIEPNFIF